MRMAQGPDGFYAPCKSDCPVCAVGADFAAVSYQPEAPKVFVVSWLDYCTKYGMGFAMADGTVCVHFNDSSSLVLAPGKMYVPHHLRIERRLTKVGISTLYNLLVIKEKYSMVSGPITRWTTIQRIWRIKSIS
jgi:hypothetical protein